jgi:hypothetical protein
MPMGVCLQPNHGFDNIVTAHRSKWVSWLGRLPTMPLTYALNQSEGPCLELCYTRHLPGIPVIPASTPAADLAKPVPDINPKANRNVFACDFIDVSVVGLQVAATDFYARLETFAPSVTQSESKHSWTPLLASPTIAGPPAFWSITTSGSLRASPSHTRRRLLIAPSGL